jgi:hypothetical protein
MAGKVCVVTASTQGLVTDAVVSADHTVLGAASGDRKHQLDQPPEQDGSPTAAKGQDRAIMPDRRTPNPNSAESSRLVALLQVDQVRDGRA